MPLLSDEQLEAIAQAIVFESPVTYISQPSQQRATRMIWFFGADMWRQFELTLPAFYEVVDRVCELWDERKDP